MTKLKKVLLNAVPILAMMGLVPIIRNDYILLLIYLFIIVISFIIKIEKKEIQIFFFGCVVMILAETVFTSTGVEKFVRNSLFGLMPIWLPVLWGYCFVAMKRGIKIWNL